MSESTQEPKQVTKPKHPGRVASGRRLVEWNKKKKEDLLKKTQKPSQEPSQEHHKEPDQVSLSAVKSSNEVYYGVGALAVVAIGLLVYFKTVKTVKKPSQRKQKNKLLTLLGGGKR